MFFGRTTREIDYARPSGEAFAEVQKALALIGQVKSVDETTLSVQGTANYGAQRVKIQVTVFPTGNTSRLTLVAKGDDIWAAGAKNCLNRLQETLGQLGTPTTPATPAKTTSSPAPSLEQYLSVGQKVTAALFLLVITIGSLDLAWRGFLGITPEVLYLLASLFGGLMGWVWVKRRYRLSGCIAGVVAGLSSVWFTTFILEQSDWTSKLIILFTAILGTLPGLAVLLVLKMIQDRLSPLDVDQPIATSDDGPRRESSEG